MLANINLLEEQKKNKGKYNRWIVFTSMPFQMGVTIYLFYWIGSKLDERYNVEGDWWMKGLTMLGVVVSLYQFIKQANRISKNE